MNKMNVSEIFGPTIQGEGKYVGMPCIFIRFSGCNLSCCFRNSICDTPYTSISPEKSQQMTPQEVVDRVLELKMLNNIKNVVLTGGEPMIQKDSLLEELCGLLKKEDFKIHIETNATIKPTPNLLDLIDVWCLSPKLKNSCFFRDEISQAKREYHNKRRINEEVIRYITKEAKESFFKFVYSSGDMIEADYLVANNPTKAPTYIMPSGISNKEFEEHKDIVDYCISRGYTYSDRLHIRLWKNRRGK